MVQPKIREGCQQISTNHLHDQYVHREQCTLHSAESYIYNASSWLQYCTVHILHSTHTAQVHSAHTSSCYPVLVHIDTQLCAISTHSVLLTKLNTALPFVQCTAVHIASTNFGFTRNHTCSKQPSTTCFKPPVLCSTTALRCGPLQMHLATILSADTNLHRRPPNPSRSLASFYFKSSQMFEGQKDLIRFRKHQQQANTFVTL